jgi:hypothetical protein
LPVVKASGKQSKRRTMLRQAERGEAQSFEFVVMVLPMMFLISVIGLVIIYWSARLPAKRAAIDCARSAIATLNQTVGVEQGEFVGVQSMVNSGAAIEHLGVEVYPLVSWTRGATVRCVVSGQLDIRDMPMLQMLPTVVNNGGIFEIYEVADMQIEPLKSDWY